MDNSTSPLFGNADSIKLNISGSEIDICVLFSLHCCITMFDQCKKGNDYRSSFAKAIFHMYDDSTSAKTIHLDEADFVGVC